MITKVGVNTLLSLPVDKFNIIDVGAHAGHFIAYLKPLLDRPSYWIGIEPMECGRKELYDVFIDKAVFDVKENTHFKFNKYIEPGCNSLLKMNIDIITHERQDGKWFVGAQIEQLVETVIIPASSLEIILDELGFTEDIHLIKIDTQGSDMAVVRSLRKYLSKVHLIQVESVSSHDKAVTLYKGQTIMEEDIEEMKGLGFKLIDIKDHGVAASPEADLIFQNVHL